MPEFTSIPCSSNAETLLPHSVTTKQAVKVAQIPSSSVSLPAKGGIILIVGEVACKGTKGASVVQKLLAHDVWHGEWL